MTPREKTRRPIFSAFDPASFASIPPLDPEKSAHAIPVSRELPVVCFADAPALPFVPYHRPGWRELHGLPVNSPLKVNRRRFHRKPPLTLAACCLLSCTNAVFVTSASGQATVEVGLQGIIESMVADEMAAMDSGVH